MVEFELNELVIGKDSLVKLLQADLPVKKAYKLGKIVKKVEEELKHFEEQRQSLLKKYGEPIENNQVKINDVERWNEDFKELISEKVELEIVKFTLDELEKAKLSAVDLNNLNKLK